MLRSFLLKLRHKPKVVRDQFALAFAGGFTFVIFGIWAFTTMPNLFSGNSDNQSASMFSGVKDYFSEDIEAFDEIVTDISEVVATSSTSTAETDIRDYLPSFTEERATTTADVSTTTSERTVRIATTSTQTATGTQPE